MRFGPFLALALGSAMALPGTVGQAKANDFAIQLMSMRSAKAANDAWDQLQTSFPNLLGDMSLSLEQADVGDRGVFFRVRTGPFPNRATAEDMCWQLRAQNQDCLVIKR